MLLLLLMLLGKDEENEKGVRLITATVVVVATIVRGNTSPLARIAKYDEEQDNDAESGK